MIQKLPVNTLHLVPIQIEKQEWSAALYAASVLDDLGFGLSENVVGLVDY